LVIVQQSSQEVFATKTKEILLCSIFKHFYVS